MGALAKTLLLGGFFSACVLVFLQGSMEFDVEEGEGGGAIACLCFVKMTPS